MQFALIAIAIAVLVPTWLSKSALAKKVLITGGTGATLLLLLWLLPLLGPKKERPVVVVDVNRVHDGTRGAGTQPLGAVLAASVGTKSSFPREFVTVGDEVYFTAWGTQDESAGGPDIERYRIVRYFKSATTESGYDAEILGGWHSETHEPEHLTSHGDALCFAATDAVTSELFVLSGGAFELCGTDGDEELGHVRGIVSTGAALYALATEKGTDGLALWAVDVAAAKFAHVAASGITADAGTPVTFVDCDHAGGGFLASGVGDAVGSYEVGTYETAWSKHDCEDVSAIAAVGERLYLAGRTGAGADSMLLHSDGAAPSPVTDAGIQPARLCRSGSKLYFAAVNEAGAWRPFVTSGTAAKEIEIATSGVGEILALAAMPSSGRVWFAARTGATVGLFEIDVTDSVADKQADLDATTVVALAATDSRIFALAGGDPYFWVFDTVSSSADSAKPVGIAAGWSPSGPVHVWNERALFAGEHDVMGVEPYHFPVLVEE